MLIEKSFAFCQSCGLELNNREEVIRLAQLVRSLTANQEVPGSSPGLVEG